MKRIVPLWLVQAIAGILAGALLSWGAWATTTAMKHDTRIAVTETKIEEVHKNIEEIKDGQKEMNRKLDRLIEKQIPSPVAHRIYGR